eukprot:3440460-Pyramimonas_sp.AAC.2
MEMWGIEPLDALRTPRSAIAPYDVATRRGGLAMLSPRIFHVEMVTRSDLDTYSSRLLSR